MLTLTTFATEARRACVRQFDPVTSLWGWTCAPGAPDWICKDGHPEGGGLIWRAHGDMLPNAWGMELIVRCLDRLAALPPSVTREDTGLLFGIVGELVDTTMSELTTWLASHILRSTFVDAAIEAQGALDHGPLPLMTLLQLGQAYECSHILESVLACYDARVHALSK